MKINGFESELIHFNTVKIKEVSHLIQETSVISLQFNAHGPFPIKLKNYLFNGTWNVYYIPCEKLISDISFRFKIGVLAISQLTF